MNHTVKDTELDRRLAINVLRGYRTESTNPKGPYITLSSAKKHSVVKEIQRNWLLILMVLPAVIYFTIQCYLPMSGIYLAFTRFDFEGGLFGSPFVGFENFKFLVSSGTLFQLTFNTVAYNIAFIGITTVIQIMVAIFLHDLPGKKVKRTAQSIMFFPYFISFVIVGTFSYNIFNYETGFYNTVARLFGSEPIDAYNMPEIWPGILTAFYVWKNLGYGVIIYLAALVGINREYYEAAEIDGAGMFQRIRHITLPQLAPTFIILLLFNLGSIMRGQFDLFYQLVGNNGNLFTTTDILDTYVYRTLRVTFDVGLGTAAGLYQSLFGFILILTVNYFIRRSRPEFALF